MERLSLVSGAAVCLALGACGSEAEPEPEVRGIAVSSYDRDDDTDEESTESEPETEAASSDLAGSVAAGVTSTYTKYNFDDCQILREQVVEGEFVEAKCAGYKGTPLYVNVDDGRFDIDVGVTNGLSTISPFNDLNDTIEWLLKDSKPFAVIARLWDVSTGTRSASALIVETVGNAGDPGCRVAHVWNTRAKMNQVARDIADETLRDGFTCPNTPRRVD